MCFNQYTQRSSSAADQFGTKGDPCERNKKRNARFKREYCSLSPGAVTSVDATMFSVRNQTICGIYKLPNSLDIADNPHDQRINECSTNVRGTPQQKRKDEQQRITTYSTLDGSVSELF